ncbi:MAG: hypothetical protein WCO56_27810 [Verrucomicrobiota bacterium]
MNIPPPNQLPPSEFRPSAFGLLSVFGLRFSDFTRSTITIGLFLVVAAAYGYYTIFSRPMSPDEGYLMLTVRGFMDGHPLYDSVFTQYGPFYYLDQWLVRTLTALPLTHDATRLFSIFHWLTASVLLALAGGVMMRSFLGGLLVFMQTVIHLSPLANEPGHPQELVVLLLALAVLLAARPSRRIPGLELLAVIGVALGFTKVNVGVFYVFALFLAIRCHGDDRLNRAPWSWLFPGVCAVLPFLLMRRHLEADWCRNYGVVMACAVAATLLVAQQTAVKRRWMPGEYLRLGACLVVPSLMLFGFTVFTGTSLHGAVDGLVLTPLRMPGVALLRLLLPDTVLLNAALALTLAICVTWKGTTGRWANSLAVLKGIYGLVGILWLVSDPRAQLGYLLPWVWLMLVPGTNDAPRTAETTFPRIFLCVMAAWQGLQGYPIAGTQVALGTMLLVVVYTVCLGDALRASPISERILPQLQSLSPRVIGWGRALIVMIMLYWFANVWCGLPELRQYHTSLTPLDLPGSRLVRQPEATAHFLRAQVQYLRTECDTFISYPGFCSLYLWAEKPPPTQLNSTGWGQLSHAQQEQIIAALRQAKRPVIVVDEGLAKRWELGIPEPIRPMVSFITEECQPVHRIGSNLIFRPRKREPNPGML